MADRVYYNTIISVLKARTPGHQRIYYDADEQAYYLVDIVKKPFWML